MKGFFVVFEGIEGAGKSTLLEVLSSLFRERGIPFVKTREPGGTETAEPIRKIILDRNLSIEPITELLLLMASRHENTVKKILPALDSGKVVISDRYRDSSLAYQGYGRGIDLSFIEELNDIVTGGLQPDVVFIIDIPVDLMMKRIERREHNRMDIQTRDFYERVRRGYLEIARRDPERYFVLDGNRDVEEITKDIVSILNKKLKEKGVGYAL